MRFEELQARVGMPDRELAEAARTSTRTVHRIKHDDGYWPRREDVMVRLAGALGVGVDEVDEFREARARRAREAARRSGVPDEVLDELGVVQEEFGVEGDFSRRAIHHAAFRLLRDVSGFLAREGLGEAVRKTVDETVQSNERRR